MVHTAACVAEARSLRPGELAAITTANAQRLFSRR
jgi:Tat protein secretion system quality control protein TatD with DNase activity